MKKVLMITLIFLFSIGSAFSLIVLAKSDSNPKNKLTFSAETHADWPDYDINELTEKADLIIIGKVKDSKRSLNKISQDFSIERQFSDITIDKTIKGNIENEIVLNQVLDYVETGENYLLFLDKGEDGYYYPMTDTATIKESNGEYYTNIEKLDGTFKEKELIDRIELINNQ
ncbi:hypothetical protein [Psychrobacillus sp. FSL K6-1267]|uniref:hypothetical protein n=1 Tax=Psychrobacillus sp. FSL K6-1267 TaxID=2921543 RepID=UPI0030FC8FD0